MNYYENNMDFIDYLKQHPFTPELNPFSKKFDAQTVSKTMDENSLEADAFLEYILMGNNQYKALFEYLKTLKDNKQVPYYFVLAITLINHDYMEVTKIMHEQMEEMREKNNGVQTSLDYQKVKIQTPLSDFSLMPFSDALTETLDLLFSFFGGINDIPQKLPVLKDDFWLDDATFYNLHLHSEYFVLLKGLYEKICFEKMTVEKTGDTFYMKDLYDGYTLYRQLGFQRIEQNITMNMQRTLGFPLRNRFMGKYDIDKVSLNGNDEICISYKRKSSGNLYVEAFLKSFLSAIQTYHYHLSEDFKQSLSMTAEVWVILIYLTQQFVEHTKELFQKYIGSNNGIVPYSKYQFKIRAKDIVILIEKITGYDKSIILEKLKLFENNGSESFWKKPLFKNGDWVYIAVHSLHSTMPVYLIDEWLKQLFKGNYDSKGTLFEDSLKTEIKRLCNGKKFFTNVLEQKKYSYKDENGKKQVEEIDLIWESKNCIVIGEVKCIDYPFTSRIANNHFQVLEKAALQIKRKKEFFEKHKELFDIKDFNKQIVPCVVLNYPCYSGLKIDDVPVVDIGLFQNYISVGGLGDCSIGLGLYDETTYIREKYYSNEDEFSNNIVKLVNDSPYLNQLKTHYKKIEKDLKVSDKFSIKYDAYENVDYKPGAEK